MSKKSYDDDFGVILSADSMTDFMRIARKYPAGNAEENLNLFYRYKEGDTEAYELLILSNVRAIASFVNAYKHHFTSFEMNDLLQEGIALFIEALNKFDPTKGKNLLSYAGECIKGEILRIISTKDKMIKRNPNVNAKVSQYRKLVAQNPSLSDEELTEALDVTATVLERIKDDYKLDADSLNKTVYEDNELEIGSTISYTETGYSRVLESIYERELLAYFKTKFSPFYYYILYHRVFAEDKMRDQAIADKFGISRARVDQIEKKIYRIIRALYTTDKRKFDRELYNLQSTVNVEKFDVTPREPEEYIKYMFVKVFLNERERKLYKCSVMRNHDRNYWPNILSMTQAEIDMTTESIRMKLEKVLELDGGRVYTSFRDMIINKYGSKLLEADLDAEHLAMSLFRYNYSLEGMTYEKIVDKISADGIEVHPDMMKMLRFYFLEGETILTKDEVEREVNAVLYGFKKRATLPLNVLYDVLVKNKTKLSDEFYMYAMAKVFHRIPVKRFEQAYPNSIISGEEIVLRKLEQLYFNVGSYGDFRFTKEKYLLLRDRVIGKMSPDDIYVLDLYLGVGCEKHSIEDVGVKLGISHAKAHAKIRSVREAALRLYINDEAMNVVCNETYVKLLSDDSLDFSESGRELALMLYRDKKTMVEIAKETNLSPQTVSNRINDVIRKADYYRFGISKSDGRYSLDEFKEALGSSKLSDKEKEAAMEAFRTRDYNLASEKYGISVNRVRSIMKRLYVKCRDLKISRISLSEKEIKEEILKHKAECILRDEERQLLSMLYGVRTEYNIYGVTFSPSEIESRMQITPIKFGEYKRAGLESIKALKAGISSKTNLYMKRSEVAKLMSDERVPLNNREKEILCYFLGLNGYPCKSYKEISEMFFKGENSLFVRLQRIFLTLYKYRAGEIAPKKSFETDFEPYLKFFAKVDQAFLLDVYKYELRPNVVMKKYGLSRSQYCDWKFTLEVIVADYRNGLEVGYDFDYFWDHVDDIDVPFYGDKEIFKKAIYDFYERKKSSEEIAADLGISVTKCLSYIFSLLVAVAKKRCGFKKAKQFSYEEIRDYYLRHVSEMGAWQKAYYYRYFDRKNNPDSQEYRNFSDVSPAITLDLLKEKRGEYFELSSEKRQKVIEFLKKYRKEISRGAFLTLMKMYDIKGRDLMSNKDATKVFEFLVGITKDDVLKPITM